MSQQIEITSQKDLLDKRGEITQQGWARFPYWQYHRKKIKAPWFMIKEWDYYYILSDDLKKGITFTISDLGYAGLMAMCWLDFEKNTFTQIDTISPLSRGKITGESPDLMEFNSKKLSLKFEAHNGKRLLTFGSPEITIPGEGIGLNGQITLEQPEKLESMNIATSWKENRRRFYYNRKINCMSASGIVRTGESEYNFNREKDSGGLDWGRGVWTYTNRWYWGSASGLLNGNPFGFNLGYGFSDRSPASENMLFYKGIAHKLDEIQFVVDGEDYMKPWRFTSNDGRFEMDFTPAVDRYSEVNLLAIKSIQHQVFGRFSGLAILDSGEKLILDNFLGFAEDVYNRW